MYTGYIGAAFSYAGTVIDNGICHPKNNDFYLCAHAGMIVSPQIPVLYCVLQDSRVVHKNYITLIIVINREQHDLRTTKFYTMRSVFHLMHSKNLCIHCPMCK